MRRVEPTRLGNAVSQNCADSESVMPTLLRLTTMTVQRTQMLKPMCSANTDRIRFLRAVLRPPFSQVSGSSGFQPVIQPRASRCIVVLHDRVAGTYEPQERFPVSATSRPCEIGRTSRICRCEGLTGDQQCAPPRLITPWSGRSRDDAPT